MGEKTFYFKDGNAADDLDGLIQELNLMNEETFAFHVTPDKNDFAAWIENSLGIKELAEELKDITDKEHTKLLIADFLKTNQESTQEVKQDETGDMFEEPKDSDTKETSEEKATEADIPTPEQPAESNEQTAQNSNSQTKDSKETVASSDEVIADAVENLKKEPPIDKKEIFDEPPKNRKFSLTHALPSKPLRTLMLGTGFGIVLGMIIMLILVNLGIF